MITGERRYRIQRPGSDKPEHSNLPGGKVTPGGEWGSFIAAVRAGDPSMANGNVHRRTLQLRGGPSDEQLVTASASKCRSTPKPATFGDNADAAEHFLALHEIMHKDAGIKDSPSTRLARWLEFDAQTERFVGEHSDEANVLVKDPMNPGFEVPSVAANV